MSKILAWIKKNILGLEPPKKKKKKFRTAAAKKTPAGRKKIPAKLPQKKAREPVKKAPVSPAAQKKFKQNSADLLKVSKSYLKKPEKVKPPVEKIRQIPPEKCVPAAKEKSQGKPVGVITHFFPNVSAAIIKINRGNIALGESLYFKGPVTDFKITVKSMQMNRAPIEIAVKGQEIGIQVPDKVRPGDEVLKVTGKKRS